MYADGNHDLIALAEKIGVSAIECFPLIQKLWQEKLLKW